MNEYKEYMDKITASPDLQEKITQRLAQVPTTKKQNKKIRRFVEFAACLVVLLSVVLLIPHLTQNEAPSDTGQNGHFAQDPNVPVPPYSTTATHGQNVPTTPPALHALTFNEVEGSMAASWIMPAGYFDYDLTDAQIRAVFPGLDMQLQAGVQYRADGTVRFVSASEYIMDGTRGRSTGTTIVLGYVGILPDSTLLIPRYDPIVSNVHGVEVTAFVYGMDDEFFRADFVLDGIAYRVETNDLEAILFNHGERDGMARLTALVNAIIINGAADLSVLADPVIPELRNDRLTLAEARNDADFGGFLPVDIPLIYMDSNAYRQLNTRFNNLFAFWDSGGMDSISWRVSTPTADDLLNIVSLQARERFDVNLYEIPWFDSVPDAYFHYFQMPVFLAEEFSLEAIQARTRWVNDPRRGILPRWETSQFGVLLDDVIIVVSTTGVAPEDIWAMFQSVPQINLR